MNRIVSKKQGQREQLAPIFGSRPCSRKACALMIGEQLKRCSTCCRRFKCQWIIAQRSQVEKLSIVKHLRVCS